MIIIKARFGGRRNWEPMLLALTRLVFTLIYFFCIVKSVFWEIVIS